MGARRHNLREQQLLHLANRQFGLLRQADLVDAGLTRNDIDGRVEACRLTRLHRGIYAFGHCALQDKGRWLAALWACDDRAALAYTSASAYFGWTDEDQDAPVQVATTASIRSRPGIDVHRVRHLEPIDVHRAHPFRVTTIPRTLVDLADVLPWPAFRAVADGQRTLRLDSIRAAQRRNPKRPGAPLVTRLLESDDAHTKSEFERRFLGFCRAYGLPRPDALNQALAGHRVDCLYVGPKLALELDGRAYHERRAQMRADRRRDSDIQLTGHRVMRLVWDDLHPDEACDTAHRVSAMLALG